MYEKILVWNDFDRMEMLLFNRNTSLVIKLKLKFQVKQFMVFFTYLLLDGTIDTYDSPEDMPDLNVSIEF